jgi:chloramphenicol 3-O-phosphotransferase
MAVHRDEPAVFLITGPSASGKSTVARLLAGRFSRGVHLEGDFFRRSVVAGRHEMTPAPSREALEQLRLRYRLGAAAADAYFEQGFTVVLEDVVAGSLLSECVTLIRSRPLHVVILMPTIDAVSARAYSRASAGYGGWTVAELYELFEKDTPRIGFWLDSSEQSAEETVEAILSNMDGG